MSIDCHHVSMSEAGREYFQVLLAEQKEEECPYLLIQRRFDYDDDEPPDPCYFETHDERFIGHFDRMKAELSRLFEARPRCLGDSLRNNECVSHERHSGSSARNGDQGRSSIRLH